MSKISKPVKRSIVPLGDNVLIKEAKFENKNKTGIILPDSFAVGGSYKEGKVIAVGEGKFFNNTLVKLSVEKGDVVLFSSGELIEFEGEKYFLVKESEISAKIK